LFSFSVGFFSKKTGVQIFKVSFPAFCPTSVPCVFFCFLTVFRDRSFPETYTFPPLPHPQSCFPPLFFPTISGPLSRALGSPIFLFWPPRQFFKDLPSQDHITFASYFHLCLPFPRPIRFLCPPPKLNLPIRSPLSAASGFFDSVFHLFQQQPGSFSHFSPALFVHNSLAFFLGTSTRTLRLSGSVFF